MYTHNDRCQQNLQTGCIDQEEEMGKEKQSGINWGDSTEKVENNKTGNVLSWKSREESIDYRSEYQLFQLLLIS